MSIKRPPDEELRFIRTWFRTSDGKLYRYFPTKELYRETGRRFHIKNKTYQVQIRKRVYYTHNVIAFLTTGEWPSGKPKKPKLTKQAYDGFALFDLQSR